MTSCHALRARTPGGLCYHAINRGNRRAEVFPSDADYDKFLRLLAEATARFPLRLIAFCLMPNHFHLAVWPPSDSDLSAYMHWLLTTHASHYQKFHRSTATFGRAGLKYSRFKKTITC